MPWSGDTQEYLDSLYTKRASMVGTRATAFSDQSWQADFDSLNAEISRVERVLATASRGTTTRYAATSKGC